LALALSGSLAATGAAQNPQKTVSFGQRFELKVGESARMQSEPLQIGFEDVVSDSRCPKGEQCIRAGNAEIRVWLQKGSDARVTRELRTSEGDDEGTSVASYLLRLEDLAPYPVAGKETAKPDYVASLVVTRN
jgi:hypothetical protein